MTGAGSRAPGDAFRPTSLLVTGGAGFIGSNFIRAALARDAHVRLVNFDALTYAGNLENLADLADHPRYTFVHGDIRDHRAVRRAMGEHGIDALVHFAAESHVDRSIMGPADFVDTNVKGTLSLLEAARERGTRFLHVSTDEVYGSLEPDGPAFTEHTPLAPNSPYAASKAGSDMLVRAWHETFDLPTLITRCSNNYGPYQFPEKLIPLMITRALADQRLPVYGDGRNVRDWLHVTDHVEALWTVLTRGDPGAVYNIGGESEVANIEIVRRLLALLDKPETLIEYVPDRPGHDRRYAMDINRIRHELAWQPHIALADGLQDTVQWYLEHRAWWERVLNEAYQTTNAMYLKGV